MSIAHNTWYSVPSWQWVVEQTSSSFEDGRIPKAKVLGQIVADLLPRLSDCPIPSLISVGRDTCLWWISDRWTFQIKVSVLRTKWEFTFKKVSVSGWSVKDCSVDASFSEDGDHCIVLSGEDMENCPYDYKKMFELIRQELAG